MKKRHKIMQSPARRSLNSRIGSPLTVAHLINPRCHLGLPRKVRGRVEVTAQNRARRRGRVRCAAGEAPPGPDARNASLGNTDTAASPGSHIPQTQIWCVEAGSKWSLKSIRNIRMEKKKLIRRSLQPARPVRCSSSSDSTSTFTVNFHAEFSNNNPLCLNNEADWWWKCSNFHGLPHTEDLNYSKELQDPGEEVTEPPTDALVTPNVWPSENIHLKSSIAAERITYSRDFLMKLSSLAISRKKPDFLPDHPIVLKNPMDELDAMETVEPAQPEQQEKQNNNLYEQTEVWLPPYYPEQRALSSV